MTRTTGLLADGHCSADPGAPYCSPDFACEECLVAQHCDGELQCIELTCE